MKDRLSYSIGKDVKSKLKNNLFTINKDLIKKGKFLSNKSQKNEDSLQEKVDKIYIKIKHKCQQIKYYKCIIFMVHLLPDKTLRKLVIGHIADVNSFLAARIVMTICEDNQDERYYLLSIIANKFLTLTNLEDQRLSLLSLIELEEYELFETLLKNNHKLFRSVEAYSFLRLYIPQLRPTQQLAVIDLLLKYNKTFKLAALKSVLESTYEANESNASKVLEIANSELLKNNWENVVILLNFSKLWLHEKTLSTLGKNFEIIDQLTIKREGFKRCELELYYFLKYHLTIKNINDWTIWFSILKQENVHGYLPIFQRLIKSYFNSKIITIETIRKIFAVLNLNTVEDDNYYDDNYKDIHIESFTKGMLFFQPPFFSLMKNEKKYIDFLDRKAYQEYQNFPIFQALVDKKNSSDYLKKYTEDKLVSCYEYFDDCLNNYLRAENFVRVYFNSPMRLFINFDYFIIKVAKKFNYDTEDLIFLLKNMIFKGKIRYSLKNSVLVFSYDYRSINFTNVTLNYDYYLKAGTEIYYRIIGFDSGSTNENPIIGEIVSPKLSTMNKLGARVFFDINEIHEIKMFFWRSFCILYKIPNYNINNINNINNK